MAYFKIHYGNYIHKYEDAIECSSEEEAIDTAYTEARMVCEDTQGQHGFGSIDEFIEEGMSEEEAYDAWAQHVEDHTEYSAEEITEEEYNKHLKPNLLI